MSLPVRWRQRGFAARLSWSFGSQILMNDYQRTRLRLEELISNGSSVDDSVRAMFESGDFGLLPLAAAVESVALIPGRDAKRMVVRATESFMGDESESVKKRLENIKRRVHERELRSP